MCRAKGQWKSMRVRKWPESMSATKQSELCPLLTQKKIITISTALLVLMRQSWICSWLRTLPHWSNLASCSRRIYESSNGSRKETSMPSLKNAPTCSNVMTTLNLASHSNKQIWSSARAATSCRQHSAKLSPSTLRMWRIELPGKWLRTRQTIGVRSGSALRRRIA